MRLLHQAGLHPAGKFDAYVLVFIHLGSRRVYRSQPAFHPDEAWVMQQARNVIMWLDNHGIVAWYEREAAQGLLRRPRRVQYLRGLGGGSTITGIDSRLTS